MLNFTPTQLAILAILFVAGWLFGLASHPGGAKWKTRYLAERDAHAAARKDGDARVAAANTRITELEHENTRLAHAAPVTTQTIAPRDMAVAPHGTAVAPGEGVTRPVVQSSARPATTYPVEVASAHPASTPGAQRGWFDWHTR